MSAWARMRSGKRWKTGAMAAPALAALAGKGGKRGQRTLAFLISTEPPQSHLMSLRRQRLLVTEAYEESDDGDEPCAISTGIVDG